MHLYKRLALGNVSVIRTTTSQFMHTKELCHSKVLVVASVKWKPEKQEAGSVASQLIQVRWWGPQALGAVAGRAGGEQPEGPWSKRPGGREAVFTLHLLHQANALLLPPVALKYRFPLHLHPSSPWSSSCPSAAGEENNRWKINAFSFFTALLQHPFLPFGFTGTGLLCQS